MRSPRLADLPPPPPGRTGWPWTRETETGVVQSPALPSIGIVTPSCNQVDYLEETIRSVLLQGYPDFQYAVIDGASTDGSVDIIRRYAPWLTHWESVPDRGQSHAINKGAAHLSASLLNWINSDDLLLPGGLLAIGLAHLASPQSLLAGQVAYVDHHSTASSVQCQGGLSFPQLVEFWNYPAAYHQPGIFISRDAWNLAGGVDESLHYAFDYDVYCRILRSGEAAYLDQPVAAYREHDATKSRTAPDRFYAELCAASSRHWDAVEGLRFPAGDDQGAGMLLRAGCWMMLHGQSGGLGNAMKAIRRAPISAIASTALYLPGWLLRRSRRQRVR